MERPRVQIEKDDYDRAMEVLGLLALVLMIGLPVFYYGQLPEDIPRHFGSDGRPDGFSGKAIIWILPLIGAFMYVSMAALNKYPHIFNYTVKITEENAPRQYAIATKMIRSLNTLVACVFAYITYATIQVALGRQEGLGNYFLIAFLVLIFGTTAYFLFRSLKEK
jgi:uncharacterized membrane protein